MDRVKCFQDRHPLRDRDQGLTLPPVVEYLANDLNIAILSSRFSTIQLISQLTATCRMFSH